MSNRQTAVNGTRAGEAARAAALAETAAGKAEVFYGDASDNAFNVDNTRDLVIEKAGQGQDTVFSSADYTLPENVENLTLVGRNALNATGNGSGNVLSGNDNRNTLLGLGGSDTLYGHGGNDVLDGGSGADKLYGGNGHDVYYADNANDLITELAGQGTDTVFSSVSHTLAAHVENLTLTGSGNINGFGNNENNILNGNNGNNRLFGGRGGDRLLGLGGNDLLAGGGGGDRLYGGAGNDRLVGGKITALIKNGYGELYYPDSGDGEDYLDGGAGSDLLEGGAGSDTYFFARGYGHDTINDYRTPGVETVSDPQGGNIVRFGAGIRPEDLEIRADIWAGGNIADVWHIALKNTQDMLTINKQSADEESNMSVTRFEFDSGTFSPWELAARTGIIGNSKTINIGNSGGYRMKQDDFGVGDDNAQPEFRLNIEKITGGRLAYLSSEGEVSHWITNGVVYGSDADRLILVPDRGAAETAISFKFEGTGNSYGERSNDALHTIKFNVQNQDAGGGSLLFGDVNGNTINGSSGDDTINGWTGNDRLNGRGGNDILHGGAGNDTLDGGAGNDHLNGGAGHDVYLFGRGSGLDTLADTAGTNSVRFGQGIKPADLTVTTVSGKWPDISDWEIGIAGSSDKLLIERQNSGKNAAVTKFVFDSGTFGNDVLEGKISEAKLAAALGGTDSPAAPDTAAYTYNAPATAVKPDDTAAGGLLG